MTTYGVTSEGFVIKPLSVIKEEIEAEQRALINPGLNQAAHTVLGQLNGIFAAKLREGWELAEAVYNARNPDAATGAALDEAAALCPGINRLPASRSTVAGIVSIDPGTTLPVGSVASVADNPAARFRTTEEVSNLGNSVPLFCYVAMEAEETGPVVANRETLTVIETPVAGWNAIINDEDALIGDDPETDSAFRLRREETIRLAGSTHVDAIRADVSEVDNVQSVTVFENDSDVWANSMAPHSIRVMIYDNEEAEDEDVARAIFESKAAGINTNGNVTESVEDDNGNLHVIRFDRAILKDVVISHSGMLSGVWVNDDAPADWEDQIKNALMSGRDMNGDGVNEFKGINDLDIGAVVVRNYIVAIIMSFPWVLDADNMTIGWDGEEQGTANLFPEPTEKPYLQYSDISLT